MKNLVTSSLLLFCLSVPAFSSSNPAECKSLDDNELRLACYDKAFAVEVVGDVQATVPTEVEEPAVESKWSVRSKKSEIDDSQNVYMTLESDDQISGRFGSPGPMILIVRCMENRTSLYIRFNGLFMSDYQYGKVTYRLDELKAKSKNMDESSDNQALGLWNGGSSIPFIKQMFGHDKMLVRATPHSESAVTATFTISGLEREVEPLRKACNW